MGSIPMMNISSTGPTPTSSTGGGYTGNSVTYKVPAGGEAPLCFLVNTGEYCAEVVPQLESLIKIKMLPSLADRVDLGPEADMFMDLVAHALKVTSYTQTPTTL